MAHTFGPECGPGWSAHWPPPRRQPKRTHRPAQPVELGAPSPWSGGGARTGTVQEGCSACAAQGGVGHMSMPSVPEVLHNSVAIWMLVLTLGAQALIISFVGGRYNIRIDGHVPESAACEFRAPVHGAWCTQWRCQSRPHRSSHCECSSRAVISAWRCERPLSGTRATSWSGAASWHKWSDDAGDWRSSSSGWRGRQAAPAAAALAPQRSRRERKRREQESKRSGASVLPDARGACCTCPTQSTTT